MTASMIVGRASLEAFRERVAELGSGRDPMAVGAERPGDLAVVDVEELVHLGDHVVVEQRLDVLLEGERLVVEDDHDDGSSRRSAVSMSPMW